MKAPLEGNGPVEGRFLTIKIRIPVEDYKRGLPYFSSRKKLNEYAVEAVREKINRAAANDKTARLRELETNAALLEPVIRELCDKGKLSFLRDILGDRDNG